ncbi:MAG: hypothetical protein KGM60_10885 [Comamonadaceae bacterium]|nr:hypothetical protein [Comamonadaceae bacterium]
MHYLPDTVPEEAVDAIRPAFGRSDDQEPEVWIERCRNDLAQLWRLNDCWLITEVRETKKGRAVHLLFIAGIYEPDIVDEANAWARSLGCVRSYFTGRPGWVPKRPDYKLRTITMDKEL